MKFATGLGVGMVVLLAGHGALAAQAPVAAVSDPYLGLHPKVFAAADALGMVRGVGPGQTAANVVVTSYEGTGTLGGRAVAYRHEYVYAPYAAARITTTPQGGQAMIAVVREGRAWNESAPGVNPVDVKSGAERRMADIYLTPHGAVRAAVTAAPGSVTVTESGGSTTLALSLGIGALRIRLDAEHRPARVELKLARGGRSLALEYSGYKDFNRYGVFAPSAMVLEENGKRVGELAVASFHENPYVIVPTPEKLREAATTRSN